MAVEHDENLLLRITIYATHGNVDIIVAVDEVHAWHIGCQHLLQVTGTASLNHLCRDERRRHRHLCQTLCLIGRRDDGWSHACLDMVHNFYEGRRVL